MLISTAIFIVKTNKKKKHLRAIYPVINVA